MVEVATDQYGQALTGASPRGVSLARTVVAVNSSTYIALNPSTRFLRVYAIAKDVYLKWASSDTDYVNASNFDEVIIAGSYLDFVPPLNIDGGKFAEIQVVGRESGATVIAIEK